MKASLYKVTEGTVYVDLLEANPNHRIILSTTISCVPIDEDSFFKILMTMPLSYLKKRTLS